MSDIVVPKSKKVRVWTEEQKREQAAKMREHWKNHPHPRSGATTPPSVRAKQSRTHYEQVPLGYCKACGMPYYSKESAKYGMGPLCLKQAVRDRTIELDGAGRPVPLHLTSVHGKLMPKCELSVAEWVDLPVIFVPVKGLEYSTQDWHPELVVKWAMALETPPVWICETAEGDTNRRWVRDGRYRVHAHRRMEQTHILARVHVHIEEG